MSFWDNVKKFAQPYSDDEFDDYEDEDYMDDYEEPVAEQPAPRRRRAAAPAAPVEDVDDAFTGFAAAAAPAPAPAPAAPTPAPTFNNHASAPARAGGKQEVTLFRPMNFNEASKAAQELRMGKVVVVNLENVDKAMGRRVVDFLTGCAFAIDGSIKKIGQSVYLFCPSHLTVTGDLESLQAEVDSYV